MAIRVEPLGEDRREAWDAFVDASNDGTIFHRLDFLAYHEDRFRANEHHLVVLKGQELYGVMPMAIFAEEGARVAKSPYGGSYGGPVFRQPLDYGDSVAVVAALVDYLDGQGVETCVVTPPLAACARRPSETFRLALMERGFRCATADISSVVPLDRDGPVALTSRARNMASKARRVGVSLVHRAPLDHFWPLLRETLGRRGVIPTHSARELEWLAARFKERVYVDVAYHEERPIAGAAYFVINDRVNASFYLCQDAAQRERQGLSLLVAEALERTRRDGFRWFDFGTSSAQTVGRPNLFRFKESFGAVGMFRTTFVRRAGTGGGGAA